MKTVGNRSIRKIKLLSCSEESSIIKKEKLQYRRSIKLLFYVQNNISILIDEYSIVHHSCQDMVYKVSIDKSDCDIFF